MTNDVALIPKASGAEVSSHQSRHLASAVTPAQNPLRFFDEKLAKRNSITRLIADYKGGRIVSDAFLVALKLAATEFVDNFAQAATGYAQLERLTVEHDVQKSRDTMVTQAQMNCNNESRKTNEVTSTHENGNFGCV